MIIHKQGDLFTSDAPILGHGINCKGAMRAGIATQFSKRFPDMYEWYKKECRAFRIKPGHAYLWPDPSGVVIANIASQYRPGNDARYDWTIAGLREVIQICEESTIPKFAIPLIGCGIGGLNWDVLETKIQREFGDHKTDIEVWTYE